MQYSCAYFTDWGNALEKAQHDKLEMICRKLRLKPGERLLDIGCGWGGLVCHAAEHYGVRAHGITLSEAQLALARERIAAKGLGDRVTVEIQDYADLTGSFDKIASIGMYEHIGLANIPALFRHRARAAGAENGLFLNHAISRRAKRKKRRFAARAEQRALLRYIFPGGELDDIGHTVAAMEQTGFEVHDVEAWRQHYALHDAALVRAPDRPARGSGRAGRRGDLSHLGGLSGGRARSPSRAARCASTRRSPPKAPKAPPPCRRRGRICIAEAPSRQAQTIAYSGEIPVKTGIWC